MSSPAFASDRWIPDPGSLTSWRVGRLMAEHCFDDFRDLHARSVAEPEWFYRTAFEDLGLDWPVEWSRLYDDGEGLPLRRWFVGGRTNLSWLAVDRWAARRPTSPALIWEGEEGETRTTSFAELRAEVAAVAAGLRRAGIEPGDVVAMYLPMVPEAAVLLLAVARIGAIVAPAFSGYGDAALAERLRLSGAKMLVAADGYPRRGAMVDSLGVARRARRAAGVRSLVVVERAGGAVLGPDELSWAVLANSADDEEPEMFEPERPFLVAYTSGSTGRPKGTVHVHGGLPYRWAIDCAYGFDIDEGDRFTWLTDMGWVMGPLAICGSLVLGATLVLLESFDYPSPARLWSQLDRHQVSFLGLSPTLVRLLANAEGGEPDHRRLSSLRTIGSTGEPMTPTAWRWMHEKVGKGRVPIINATGGTEVGAALLLGSPVVETAECRFSGPALGIDAVVLDPDWRRVVGSPGELAVRRPWPSMTRGFFGESSERYLESYWSRLPGTWVHGDRAIEFADGTWEIPGRSDDVIKVAGKRVGPSEFESIAVAVEGIGAAIAVGIPDDLKGEVVIVLVSGARAAEPVVRAAVSDEVAAGLGKPLRLRAVLAVTELPLLRSGKLHRRAARAWLTGTDAGDLSSLANPTSETAVREAASDLTNEGGA